MSAPAFEAIIDGNEAETLDPIRRIIIDNGFHQYEFAPEDIRKIEIRALAARGESPSTQGEDDGE